MTKMTILLNKVFVSTIYNTIYNNYCFCQSGKNSLCEEHSWLKTYLYILKKTELNRGPPNLHFLAGYSG